MSAITARETVILHRRLHDGEETCERLERWLAELVIQCIPKEEPLVASVILERLPVESYASHRYP